jgi:hypothetical protein
MADNVYNLKFTLSNGDVIDAGQITAPQGPKGDKGDSADIPYSSSTPFMDGVGSVGSANTVARGDHRHPSDTSRQEKLVSGKNIKTINGQSVLGSGDIPISGGGSGGSEYANTSEIVDNAITLTSTSTIDDLVTQILAQKTKVVRVPWSANLARLLGTPPDLTGPPISEFSVYFKVVYAGDNNLISATLIYNQFVSVCAEMYIGYCTLESGDSTDKTEWRTLHNYYPVGSIYTTTSDNVSPAFTFGGTWEQIKDVFLLAAGDTYTAGSTGGSADAVVVSHNHRLEKFGSVLALFVPASESETSAGFEAAPTGEGLWASETKAATGINHTGVDGSGKNMPPYLAVYMWKRIA